MKNSHSHFGIYACIKKNDSILLIKKSRGPYLGMYDLPGGSPEENETNEETLIREVKEETNLDVTSYTKLTNQVTTIFYKYSVNRDDFLLKHSALLYVVETYSGIINSGPDGEDSSGSKWFKISELSQNQCTPFVNILISKLFT